MIKETSDVKNMDDPYFGLSRKNYNNTFKKL